MINKAHLNKPTSVTFSNDRKVAFEHSNGQNAEKLITQKVEILVQYHTAIENGSLEHQILSQRGYNKGYRGF